MTVFLLFLALFGAMAGYAAFIEPYRIEIHRCEIHDPVLARQWGRLKIAQLSDLHIGEPDRRETKILQYLAKIRPDIIVITGDLTQWYLRPDRAIDFVKKLKAPLGVYAVLGDADKSGGRYSCRFCHPRNDYRKNRRSPHFFRDQLFFLQLPGSNGGKLTILGLNPDSKRDEESLRTILAKLPTDMPVLVLSHFSRPWATFCEESTRPLLWLSGDTHGGQVRLPGPVWKFLKLKPDPDHMAGLFHRPERHQWLYVNRGIGTTASFPFRLGVRPEITIFSFTADPQSPVAKRGK